MNELPKGALLYLSDARGVFIPRDFANETYRDCISGFAPASIDECLEILKMGPEHEGYWDAWTDILDNAIVTPRDPERTALGTPRGFTLYQDGDLWLIPQDAVWPDDETSEELES